MPLEKDSIPNNFILNLNSEWFQPEYSIPECLEPHQNLFDQPPFAWALANDDIFPQKSFKADMYDIGRVMALNLYLRNWSEKDGGKIIGHWRTAGLTGNDRIRQLQQQAFPQKRDPQEQAIAMCRALNTYFTPFKRLHEYVMYMTGNRFYTQFGEPVSYKDIPDMMQTYEAWLRSMETLAESVIPSLKQQQNIGLEDVLPRMSTPNDVANAMPPKSKPNKSHRLGTSGSMS